MRWLPASLCAALSLSVGCDDGASIATPPPVVEALPLDATAIFTRASLDLRGVRPSLEELDRLAADPEALTTMLDGLIDDPRLLERVKDLFAPAFRTRIDAYPYLEGTGLNGAVGDEPLNLVAWLVAEDRPWTDLVLAEHTVVDARLMGIWPLEQIGGSPLDGTVLAQYTDGRPHAGVLSMNAMWWRHPSTEENANRGRANALSDALLCQSFLDRPIAFPRDVDLTDSASIHAAIRENQGCTACHATLDPIASHLWGFMYRGQSLEAMARYQVGQERDWRGTTDRPPGYFGTPTNGLRHLAVQIARDERFVACAVKRVYRGLMARPLDLQDDGALAAHREVFLANGLRLKPMLRAMLDDPAYRGLAARSAFGGTPEAAAYTLVTPRILADDIAALTGYRMRFDDRQMVDLDEGLRAVAGGSDRGAATSPSTGLVLVQRGLAEAAAMALVDGATTGSLNALFPAFDDAPTAEALRDALRLTATRTVSADGPEVRALADLWTSLAALSGPRDAWVGVITALLADPERLVR